MELEHHVNRKGFTAVAIHWYLIQTDIALAIAFVSGQVTAREHAERHNHLSNLYLRLTGEDPRYLAARL